VIIQRIQKVICVAKGRRIQTEIFMEVQGYFLPCPLLLVYHNFKSQDPTRVTFEKKELDLDEPDENNAIGLLALHR